MIVAPGTFSEERFDPKAWVNATCEARPADESVDKYLSEVEMKLQLLAGIIDSVSWTAYITEISVSLTATSCSQFPLHALSLPILENLANMLIMDRRARCIYAFQLCSELVESTPHTYLIPVPCCCF